MDCSEANKVHYTDGSGSEHLYPIERLEDGDWLIGLRTTREKEQKNRRVKSAGFGDPALQNKKGMAGIGVPALQSDETTRRMVYYYGILDLHSRLLYAVMIVAAGEGSEDHAQALEMAWRAKSDSPMIGLPDILFTDNGPIGASEMGAAMLESVGVKLETHLPYNAKAKGAIERVWRTAWQRFELPFLVNKSRTFRLSELQTMLSAYLQKYNDKRSCGYYAENRSRAKMYRDGIAARELRLLPEHVHLGDLLVRTRFRTVDASCRIQWDKKFYEIIGTPSALIDKKALCRRTPLGDVEVRNPDTMIWLPTKDWSPVEFGDYRAFKNDVNNELTTAGEELPMPSRAIFENAALQTEGVIDLARAREVGIIAGETPALPAFESLGAAILRVNEIIGCQIRDFDEATREMIVSYVGEHLTERAAIEDYARGLGEELAAASAG